MFAHSDKTKQKFSQNLSFFHELYQNDFNASYTIANIVNVINLPYFINRTSSYIQTNIHFNQWPIGYFDGVAK